jgi:hypothetical protein
MADPLSSPDPPGSHMRPLTRLARGVFSASTLFCSFCKFHVQKTESRLLNRWESLLADGGSVSLSSSSAMEALRPLGVVHV